ADPRDLLGKALEQGVIDRGRLVAGHLAALLNPHFTRPVDQELGDVRLGQPSPERLEIGVEERIDPVRQRFFRAAHPAGPSVPKIRSRAVNTRIGSPCRTLIVGPRLPSCWAATEAALCPAPPTITVEAPPVTSEPAPPRIES